MSESDKGSGGSQGRRDPAGSASVRRRLSDLDARLGKARAAQGDSGSGAGSGQSQGRGMAAGLRMATELVAAIIVGGLIGFVLDRWLGTTPWLFLLFFVFGFAAGVLNVLRAYAVVQKDITARTGGKVAKSIPDDDDD